ncbi:membrane-bound lytic murein transglycosylase F [Maricaulis salignorans]|uniref:Membrane-bound lytic murein transglycosylase F n=1 Tax=Maricaulis salignorans TaxID=144026 RepID=A0A1G9U1J5_9PROT|nr:membrane-bound lytic murein transglycosylase F [Maricaulis salignorans]
MPIFAEMTLRHSLRLIAITLALAGCSEATRPDAIESVEALQARGSLVVLTLEGPTSYLAGDDGPGGYEVDLVRAFAAHLGVEAEFRTRPSITALTAALANGEGDIAAAGLTVTAGREARMQFGPAYKTVTEQLVCHNGGPAPTSLDDLGRARIVVLAGSSYLETLQALPVRSDAAGWTERDGGSAMPLLEAVDAGEFDCTIADSHLADFARRRHPDLIVAMDLSEEESLAWAYSGQVAGLGDVLTAWFSQIHEGDLLERLDEVWFGQFADFNYVDVSSFVDRVETRLPRYERWFELAAERTTFDWDLLAAQAYQESHWDPDAISDTGVRGLMMLTLSTAERVGVEDRTDPRQSIAGGAAYLEDLYQRVPSGVTGEDRIWFALAAYNVGMGHMYDARALAERQGLDKNSWDDLATVLPLLSDPAYYRDLRYGYARGQEPVRYVRKVREYRALLNAQGI